MVFFVGSIFKFSRIPVFSPSLLILLRLDSSCRISQATGSNPLYLIICFDEIPYFIHEDKGIIDGENNLVKRGKESLATASAWGESLKPKRLMPNPKETLEAS